MLGAVFSLAAYRVGAPVALAAFLAVPVIALVFASPMVGVYTAILTVPLEFASTKFGSSFSLTPTKALMIITAASVAVRLLSSATRPGIHRAHVVFAGLLAVIALGITNAVDTFVTIRILTVWAAVWLATIWVAQADRTQVRRVMLCIAFSGAILGVLALLGAGPQTLQQGGAVATNRATGSFTHPNQLGTYMVLALPVTIVLAADSRGRLRIGLLLAIALDVAGLTLTLARGAIFGALIALVVLLAWPAYRRVVLVGLALMLAVVVINPKVVQNSEINTVAARLKTAENFSQTSGARTRIWAATPRIVAMHPLIGIGEGNFSNISAVIGLLDVDATTVDHAHNILLTFAAETGLIGLGLFVWFCASVAAAGWRAFRTRDAQIKWLALALLATYVGTALMSLTDYPLVENADFSVIMVEGALLIALARLAPERSAGDGLAATRDA